MEPNGILAIIGSVLSLVLYYVHQRENTKPQREDAEIDKAIANKDHNTIDRIIHDELDGMRDKGNKK